MLFEVLKANISVSLYSSGFKSVGRKLRPRVLARARDILCSLSDKSCKGKYWLE
jgi:hypothetical protein